MLAQGIEQCRPRVEIRLAEAREGVLAARVAAADAFAANVRPIIKEIQTSGVSSLRGVAKALTARGVATARGYLNGGSWQLVGFTEVESGKHSDGPQLGGSARGL
jgi:hypothetical protein